MKSKHLTLKTAGWTVLMTVILGFSAKAQTNITEVLGQGGDDWNNTAAWTGGGALSGANNYIVPTEATSQGDGSVGSMFGYTGINERIKSTGTGSETFNGGSLTLDAGTEFDIKSQPNLGVANETT